MGGVFPAIGLFETHEYVEQALTKITEQAVCCDEQKIQLKKEAEAFSTFIIRNSNEVVLQRFTLESESYFNFLDLLKEIASKEVTIIIPHHIRELVYTIEVLISELKTYQNDLIASAIPGVFELDPNALKLLDTMLILCNSFSQTFLKPEYFPLKTKQEQALDYWYRAYEVCTHNKKTSIAVGVILWEFLGRYYDSDHNHCYSRPLTSLCNLVYRSPSLPKEDLPMDDLPKDQNGKVIPGNVIQPSSHVSILRAGSSDKAVCFISDVKTKCFVPKNQEKYSFNYGTVPRQGFELSCGPRALWVACQLLANKGTVFDTPENNQSVAQFIDHAYLLHTCFGGQKNEMLHGEHLQKIINGLPAEVLALEGTLKQKKDVFEERKKLYEDSVEKTEEQKKALALREKEIDDIAAKYAAMIDSQKPFTAGEYQQSHELIQQLQKARGTNDYHIVEGRSAQAIAQAAADGAYTDGSNRFFETKRMVISLFVHSNHWITMLLELDDVSKKIQVTIFDGLAGNYENDPSVKSALYAFTKDSIEYEFGKFTEDPQHKPYKRFDLAEEALVELVQLSQQPQQSESELLNPVRAFVKQARSDVVCFEPEIEAKLKKIGVW